MVAGTFISRLVRSSRFNDHSATRFSGRYRLVAAGGLTRLNVSRRGHQSFEGGRGERLLHLLAGHSTPARLGALRDRLSACQVSGGAHLPFVNFASVISQLGDGRILLVKRQLSVAMYSASDTN